MRQDAKFWEAVRQIRETDGRFGAEAYLLVMEALDHTMTILGEHRHVAAGELLEGFCAHAKRKYGVLALTVVQKWESSRLRTSGESFISSSRPACSERRRGTVSRISARGATSRRSSRTAISTDRAREPAVTAADDYPGGQSSSRPPMTCMCT